jgi:ribonuclease MRP protein subunit RMP1
MDTLVLTQAALKELTSTSQLLHLTHHRNKNQHRLTTWYKYLSQLRRHINKLLPELQSLETALTFTTKEKGGKENKYVKQAHEKVNERVNFMREHLFARCYLLVRKTLSKLI